MKKNKMKQYITFEEFLLSPLSIQQMYQEDTESEHISIFKLRQ